MSEKRDQDTSNTRDQGTANQAEKEAGRDQSVTPPRLRFREWAAVKVRLIATVRRSEKLTKEDLAIRINARD